MMIFVLEDGKKRTQFFRQACIGHYLDLVDNVFESKDCLTNKEYEYIFLDHDLDDLQFVDSSNPNTGWQVAKFINYNKLQKDATIVIHTLNPVGQINMKCILPRAKIIPFVQLVKMLDGDPTRWQL